MTADQDSGWHQVWDVNYSDNRKPVNKCQKHGAKPTQNNLSFEKIKLDFRNVLEFWTDPNYVQNFGKLYFSKGETICTCNPQYISKQFMHFFFYSDRN